MKINADKYSPCGICDFADRITVQLVSDIEKVMKERQKKQEAEWRKNNPEHSNYLRSRSAARSFVRTKSKIEDLEELEKLIAERKKILEKTVD